jgi:hypothetical protein
MTLSLVHRAKVTFSNPDGVLSDGMRHRLKTWLGLLPIASALLLGQAAASPEPHAVLELLVSHGCSACRPANELMTELVRDPDLMVLSLP